MFTLKIMRDFKKHFQHNSMIYFILFFCFLLGIVIGSIIIKKIDYNYSRSILEISNPYFKNINKYTFSLRSVFKSSILNNLFLIILLAFTSFISFGIILIPIIILLKGISLGLSVAILVDGFGFKGFISALFGIYPQNIFIILGLIGIAAIAFSLSYQIFKSINRIALNNVNDVLRIFLVYLFIVFLGVSIEGFLSPHILKLVKDGFSLV